MTAAQPDKTTDLAAQRIGESLAQRLNVCLDAALYADALGTDDEATVYRALGCLVIELTAGWRPPPRVIETPEQLAALPGGVIVRDDQGTIACRHFLGPGVVFGDDRTFDWNILVLPATVLREADDA
jgi:hypothetical protein